MIEQLREAVNKQLAGFGFGLVKASNSLHVDAELLDNMPVLNVKTTMNIDFAEHGVREVSISIPVRPDAVNGCGGLENYVKSITPEIAGVARRKASNIVKEALAATTNQQKDANNG